MAELFKCQGVYRDKSSCGPVRKKTGRRSRCWLAANVPIDAIKAKQMNEPSDESDEARSNMEMEDIDAEELFL